MFALGGAVVDLVLESSKQIMNAVTPATPTAK
jgi:hypothetical protein